MLIQIAVKKKLVGKKKGKKGEKERKKQKRKKKTIAQILD
jgi:hypothetical protein